MAFGLGGTEIVIILVIILVFLGARRLPEIGRNVGTALREFQTEANADLPAEESATATSQTEDDEADPDAPKKTVKPSATTGSSIEAEIVSRVLNEVPIIKRVAKIKNKLVK